MQKFMDADFLLTTDEARSLYHDFAEKLPIIDYHCHLNPREIAEDHRFRSITEAWLGGDHYTWRMMRINGVDERYITGDADDYEKFLAWADTLSRSIGNPLYHWTHLELQRFFGIDTPLTPETAPEIYEKCNELLARPDMSARGLMLRSGVELVCTTDDPADDLRWHKAIAESGFAVKVLPTYRPDRAMDLSRDDFKDYLKELGRAAGVRITSLAALLKALEKRMDYFAECGCRLSDHAFEKCPAITYSAFRAADVFDRCLAGESISAEDMEGYQGYMIRALGAMIAARDWTMQLHFGALRNNNTRMFEALGRDTGYDVMADHPLACALARLLDDLSSNGALPRTIVYTLNPKDNYPIGALTGTFADGSAAGKVQFGSAWWFADHLDGMRRQMTDLASLGMLSRFVGMLTDSRSFLSYPRHEYFRRIVCELVGGYVARGEYPNDRKMLETIVCGICHDNAASYFKF